MKNSETASFVLTQNTRKQQLWDPKTAFHYVGGAWLHCARLTWWRQLTLRQNYSGDTSNVEAVFASFIQITLRHGVRLAQITLKRSYTYHMWHMTLRRPKTPPWEFWANIFFNFEMFLTPLSHPYWLLFGITDVFQYKKCSHSRLKVFIRLYTVCCSTNTCLYWLTVKYFRIY